MDWRIKRVGQALLTVYVVTSLSFVLVRLMPGNAVDYFIISMQQEGMDPAQIQARAERLTGINPDEPIHTAYVDYMTNTLQGDLGESVWYGDPVSEILAEAIPWTLFIMSWALLIGFAVGIIFGALMAYYEGGKLDIGLTTYGMVMGSVPFYIFAILLVLFFSYRYQWFPAGGRYASDTNPGFNWPFIRGVIYHGTLPTLSMVLSGSIASLTMRGNSIRVLGADYIRVAQLRGLSDNVIAIQYVARNAILPMYTGFMISIGSMFGGSVILETVFSYRGMGWYMIDAVDTRDLPLMMGAFLVITIAVVIALLIVDLTYGKIDPRVGSEGSREQF